MRPYPCYCFWGYRCGAGLAVDVDAFVGQSGGSEGVDVQAVAADPGLADSALVALSSHQSGPF